jgi:hypothetical protein
MMIISILQLRPVLDVIKMASARSTTVETEDFEILDSIIPISSKFKKLSTFITAEKYPTICWMIQKVYYFQKTHLFNAIAINQGLDHDYM